MSHAEQIRKTRDLKSLLMLIILNWVSQVALVVKKSPASSGDIRDMGVSPGLRRSPGEGHSNPLPYSCLENPKGRGVWWVTVPRVAKNQTQQKQLSSHALCFFFVVVLLQFYFIFKLYIIVLVLANIKMNPPQVYMCSHAL